jgi:ABC-type multidrug transport system ATPase subunit
MGRKAKNHEILDELARVGISTTDAFRPVSQLSGGQRRRVSLVRALARTSDLLCLDEPYVGIDEESIDDIIAYTKERIFTRCVLFVSHNADIAQRLATMIVSLEEKQK